MITIVLSFDPPLERMYSYFVQTIEPVATSEYNTIILQGDVKREDFLSALAKSEGVFFIAHGDPQGILINHRYLTYYGDAPLYQGKIVCAVSCMAADIFGKAIGLAGGSYIGYSQDTVFIVGGQYGWDFMRVLFQPFYSLLLGESLTDAYHDTLQKYDYEIRKALKQKKYMIASMLEHDKKCLKIYGNPYASLTPEYKPNYLLPISLTMSVIGIIKSI